MWMEPSGSLWDDEKAETYRAATSRILFMLYPFLFYFVWVCLVGANEVLVMAGVFFSVYIYIHSHISSLLLYPIV